MKELISIDWLQFSARGFIKTLSEQKTFTYELAGSTPQFKEWYKVYKGKRLLFDVCACPHSPIIKPDTINVRLYNEILYHVDCFDMIRQLLSSTKWKFNNLTRVDICKDTVDVDFDTFAFEAVNDTIQIDGNHRFSFFYSQENKKRRAETFHVNNPNSPVAFKMYDKTLEMERKGHKKYITDMWQLAGWDTTKRVTRIEISVKNVYEIIEKDYVADVFSFEQEGYISALFAILMQRFKFERVEKNGDRKEILTHKDANTYEIKLNRKYTETKSVRQTRYIVNQVLSYWLQNDNKFTPEQNGTIVGFIQRFMDDCTYIDRKILTMSPSERQRLKDEIKAYYQYNKIQFE